MRNKNSFAFLSVFLIVAELAGTVQGSNGNECDSCFINSTLQDGICRKKWDCKKPCAATVREFQRCKIHPERNLPIVCCPKPRATPTRISAQKCIEYKELACDLQYASGIEVKFSTCAASSLPVIIGGQEAKRREFPHQALVGWAKGDDRDRHFGCGGTLISNTFVLSAAHCFEHPEYGPLVYVRLGEHNTQSTNEWRIDLNAAELIKYSDYRSSFIYDDIGLIRLDREVQFNEAIRPACLPEETISSDIRNAIATGWGATGESLVSNVLMKVGLELFDDIRCSDANEPNFRSPQGIQSEHQFCAGSTTRMNNTCGGDSGGPLQVFHEHHFCTYTIIGVTSHGENCNIYKRKSMGIYTRVHARKYLDWIENIVWPNETVIPEVDPCPVENIGIV